MSEFKDRFNRTGVAELIRRFGVSVQYYESLGSNPLDSVVKFQAKLTSEKQDRRWRDDRWEVVTTRQARYIASDLGTGTELQVNGIIVVDDEGDTKSYIIETNPVLNNGFNLLNLIRYEAGEIARPGYRGRSNR